MELKLKRHGRDEREQNRTKHRKNFFVRTRTGQEHKNFCALSSLTPRSFQRKNANQKYGVLKYDFKVEHYPDGGKMQAILRRGRQKKKNVGGKSIGHQHNNMPEFDVGDATNI